MDSVAGEAAPPTLEACTATETDLGGAAAPEVEEEYCIGCCLDC